MSFKRWTGDTVFGLTYEQTETSESGTPSD